MSHEANVPILSRSGPLLKATYFCAFGLSPLSNHRRICPCDHISTSPTVRLLQFAALYDTFGLAFLTPPCNPNEVYQRV